MSKKFFEMFLGFAACLCLIQPVYASKGNMDVNLYTSCISLIVCCVILFAGVVYLWIKLKNTRRKFALTEMVSVSSDTTEDEETILLKQIEEGFKNEEFKMYLQFIVDNKTKKIVSAEALSRWESASGDIIPPVKYIGVMEKYGLISRLDYYMLEMACRKLNEWKDTEFDHLAISCNFTRITISEKDFVDKINDISSKYDFDKSKLQIEITEDSVEKNLNRAMDNIHKAKELGFRIALDDIGSGYTSFISLCEYPIDVVKLDRDVLLKTEEEIGKKLFHGIVSLARYLNLRVVCEGVETEGQNTLVSESECDYIQGWYYSKALSVEKAEEFFREYMKRF